MTIYAYFQSDCTLYERIVAIYFYLAMIESLVNLLCLPLGICTQVITHYDEQVLIMIIKIRDKAVYD